MSYLSRNILIEYFRLVFNSDLEPTFRGEYPAGLLPLPDSEDWGPGEPELSDPHRPGGGVAEAQDVAALRQADGHIPRGG